MMRSRVALYHGLLAAWAAIVMPVSVAHAANVTISPLGVQNDAGAQVTLTITGLTPGQTVAVDRYADLNGNGVVDAGEPLVAHFTLTDGQVPLIGGQRNLNLPGDDDGKVDGNIAAKMRYPGVDSLDRIAVPYLYQVSDSIGGSPIGTATLNVTQNTTLAQGVHGTISAAGSPLGHVLLALLANDLVSGTVTDANGSYTLYAAPGSYTVIPVAPGLVTDQTAGAVSVSATQFTAKDLAPTAANITVSGKVTEASSHAGIGGMFVMAQSSSNLFAAAFTDVAGDYGVQVTPDQWRISLNQESAAKMGYVGEKDKSHMPVTGNVVVNFALQGITALVFGTVEDDQGHPVLGLRMGGQNQANQQQPSGMTFAPDGSYTIGVVAGTWNIGPNQDDANAMGFMPQGVTVTVDDQQALRQDFTLQPFTATAQVSGRLVKDTADGPGIGNIGVYACLQNQQGGSCVSATTGPDGSFDIGLSAGTWNIGFSSDSFAQLNLVGPQFTVTVVDGVNQSLPAPAVALPATAHITGSVQTSSSNPIIGLNVYAFATINGTNYNANGQTDGQGAYSLMVTNGDWQVGLDCNGLSAQGYVCPSNRPASISNADQTIDFVVQQSAPMCTGDCGSQHQVTVSDILTMVNIALGRADALVCQAGDANQDGQITIDEIIAAIRNALSGCPNSA